MFWTVALQLQGSYPISHLRIFILRYTNVLIIIIIIIGANFVNILRLFMSVFFVITYEPNSAIAVLHTIRYRTIH